MKIKKGLFLFFIFAVLLMCAIGANVKASDEVTLTNVGASIRTTGNAGIKFIAQIAEGESFPEDSAHGFFIAKGEHAYNDIINSINAGLENENLNLIVNGNKLLKVNVPGNGNTFSIVVTNLSTGDDETDIITYTSDLTVLPYVQLADGTYVFSIDSCTRNIGYVAKESSDNEGDLIQKINALVGGQYIDLTEEELNLNANVFVREDLTAGRSKYFINGKYHKDVKFYSSLLDAVSNATDGSLIYSYESTVNEDIIISTSNIKIIGNNLEMNGLVTISDNMSDITFEGFTFNSGITGSKAKNLIVENCVFNNSNIYFDELSGIVVKDSEFNGDKTQKAIELNKSSGSIALNNNNINNYTYGFFTSTLAVPSSTEHQINITNNVFKNIESIAIDLFDNDRVHTNNKYIYKSVVINNNIFNSVFKVMWYGAIDNTDATFNNNILYYYGGGYAVRGYYAEKIDCSNNLYLSSDGSEVKKPSDFSFAGSDETNVSINKEVYFETESLYFTEMLNMTFDSVEANYDGNKYLAEVTYTNTEYCEVTSIIYENNSRIYPGVSNAVATITVIYNGVQYTFIKEALVTINVPPTDEVVVNSSYSNLELGTEVDGYVYGINAFATITDGLFVLSENGKLLVGEGTYSESLIVNKSNVSFIGTNAVLTNVVTLSNGVSGLSFKGFTFNGGITGTTVSDLVFKNCIFEKSNVSVTTLTNITVDNCTFNGVNTFNSINISTSKGFINITNSTYDTAENAIFVNSISDISNTDDYIYIYNNYFANIANISIDLIDNDSSHTDSTKYIYQYVTINNNLFNEVAKCLYYGGIDNSNATFSYNIINCTGLYIVRGRCNDAPLDCINNLYVNSDGDVIEFDSTKFNTTNFPNAAINGPLCFESFEQYFIEALEMSFDKLKVNYNGSAYTHLVSYNEIENCDVTVNYENNTRIEVGTSKVTAVINVNYYNKYSAEYNMTSFIIIKDDYDVVVDDDFSSLTLGDITTDGYIFGENAFSNIEDALNSLTSTGGSIKVFEGTYTDALTISKSNVSLFGEDAVLSGIVTLSENVSNVRFEGFTFNSGITGSTAKNLTIENCVFDNSNIKFTTLTNIAVSNSSFNGNGSTKAVDITNNKGSLVFHNNIIDNYNYGIYTKNLTVTASNTHKIVITNNTFSNISEIAIDLDDAETMSGLLYTEVKINNNIFKAVLKVMWYGAISNTDATFNDNIIYHSSAIKYVARGNKTKGINLSNNLYLSENGTSVLSPSSFNFDLNGTYDVDTTDTKNTYYSTTTAYYKANGKLTVIYDSDVLELNNEMQISVSCTASGSTTYESSNVEVAIVDENGIVSAVSEGEVTIIITFTTANGVCIYEVHLEVVNPDDKADELLELLSQYNEDSAFNGNVKYIGKTSPTNYVYGSINGYYPGALLSVDTTYNMGVATTNTVGIGCSGGPRKGNVEFITFHDTAGSDADENAAAIAKYLTTQKDAAKGWHYTIDESSIYQSLDESVKAWHAGDGGDETTLSSTGIKVTDVNHRPVVTINSDGYFCLDGVQSTLKASNNKYSTTTTTPTSESTLPRLGIPAVIKKDLDGVNYYYIPNIRYDSEYGSYGIQGGGSAIAIESCVNDGSDLYLTWHNSAKFIATLLVKYNLTPDRVVFHNNFSNKVCPYTMINAGLVDKFLNLVYAEYYVAKYFSDWTITFTSGNQHLVDNNGRIVSKVATTTQVKYRVTVSNSDGTITKSIDLVATIKGTNS